MNLTVKHALGGSIITLLFGGLYVLAAIGTPEEPGLGWDGALIPFLIAGCIFGLVGLAVHLLVDN